MKAFELAKELGIESKNIVDFLVGKGEDVKNHFSVLTEEQIAMTKEQFKAMIVKEESMVDSKTLKKNVTTEAIKSTKKFVAGDLITCRCVKNNKVIAMSPKNNIRYTWNGFGDTNEVDYADLVAWKSGKQPIIFQPKIIIEDIDLLTQWEKELKDIYEQYIGIEDPNDYFEMTDSEFEKIMRTSPLSIQVLILSAATKLVKENKFKSLQKLQVIDEVMHTIVKEFI